MDRMEDEENEESDDIDDDSDTDDISEDEGYNTSPEVDFDQFDYWALGLNSHLWRISLYKDCNDCKMIKSISYRYTEMMIK